MHCRHLTRAVWSGALLAGGVWTCAATQAASLRDTVALGAFLDGVITTQIEQFPGSARPACMGGSVGNQHGSGDS
jgi:hypothetical protein